MPTEEIVVISIRLFQFCFAKAKLLRLEPATGGLLSQPHKAVKRAAASTRGHPTQLFPDSEKVF
jgi:hypothetical protein